MLQYDTNEEKQRREKKIKKSKNLGSSLLKINFINFNLLAIGQFIHIHRRSRSIYIHEGKRWRRGSTSSSRRRSTRATKSTGS